MTAREEWIAPMAARAAAARNNKQKKRRHGDGVNVRTGFGFVIIELLVFRVVMDAERTFIQSADNASSFFRKFYTLLRTHLINWRCHVERSETSLSISAVGSVQI